MEKELIKMIEKTKNQEAFLNFLRFCLPRVESGLTVEEIWDAWQFIRSHSEEPRVRPRRKWTRWTLKSPSC